MMWIIDNLDTIFILWGALVALCSAIVALTPTQKDNKVWEKVVKVADKFSVVLTKEDAKTLAQALKKRKK